jgi:hypothetical protein
MIYTLEGAQQGIGSLMVGPAWVKGLHDLVVLCEERGDGMTNGEDGAKESLHAAPGRLTFILGMVHAWVGQKL